MSQCEITVIIPTYNKVERIKYLLESLTIQDPSVLFNTIIVDDGSNDSTEKLINQYKDRINLTYLHQKNAGRSHARNFGLNEATTEYVIFTDDDVILPSDYVRNHLRSLQRNDKTLVHGKIWNLPFLSYFKDPATGELMEGITFHAGGLNNIKKHLIDLDIVHNQQLLDRQKRTSLQEKYLHEIFTKQVKELYFLLCTGNNFSCSRKSLLDVGGFDEVIDRQWGAEDIELGYRLQKNNLNFIYDHNCYVFHICHYRTTYEEELLNSFKLFYEFHKDEIILAIPQLLLRKITTLDEFVNEYISK